MGRYISEFQNSLQGIYTRTTRIIYPVDYVKTYSYKIKRLACPVFCLHPVGLELVHMNKLYDE